MLFPFIMLYEWESMASPKFSMLSYSKSKSSRSLFWASLNFIIRMILELSKVNIAKGAF